MKLQQQKCSNCGALLDLDVEDTRIAFCPYCGGKYLFDDGKTEHTINENVSKNINVTKTVHNLYTDEVELLKEKNKDKNKSFNRMLICISVCVAFLAIIVGLLWGGISKSIKQREIEEKGLISAGNYRDFVDENYQDVEAQLKAAGFTNIELVEVADDYLEEERGKVKSVSIGGKTKFKKRDYFSSDTKVIISFYKKDGGLIIAGNSEDFIGQDYETVTANLKAAGFTNIELVEISAGLALWKKGEVVSISIGGKTTFYNADYFSPDAKVVISHYKK